MFIWKQKTDHSDAELEARLNKKKNKKSRLNCYKLELKSAQWRTDIVVAFVAKAGFVEIAKLAIIHYYDNDTLLWQSFKRVNY